MANYSVDKHLIRLDGLLNLRELGGLPTVNGGQTRFKRLLRSDYWQPLAPSAQAFLLDYGLRAVIDLRDTPEVDVAPDVFAASSQVAYHHRPFFDDAGQRAGPPDLTASKGSRYLTHLDLYQENVAAIFRAIAAAREGVTLFHCVAGKDRTGLTAALLLELAGVPDDCIVQDYAGSEQLLAPRTAELRAEAVRRGEDMTLFVRRAACQPETMQEVLDGLRTRYGGAEGYLRQIGLNNTEIRALRARLVG